MRKFLINILIYGFCLPIAAKCQKLQRETAGGYQLVWADEFNNEGAPDSANWQYEHGFIRNNELQWTPPQNSECHNGILIIQKKKEHLPNPNYIAGRCSFFT